MTIAFYCRASGRHIGLDELQGIIPSTIERWKVHKFYCPYCGNYTSALPESQIRQSGCYKYG